MDRAAELLTTSALTVREVAHRVGYRQPAQFAKAFRRHPGLAPSDYRAERGRRPTRRPHPSALETAPGERAAHHLRGYQ